VTKRYIALALIASAAAAAAVWPAPSSAARNGKSPKRVLIVSQAAGFRHSSIPVASATAAALGAGSGEWMAVGNAETGEQVAQMITAERLKDVDLVFFANTTGTLNFTPAGRTAFYEWIQNGGAWAGVHSAGDTFHGDPDFLNLLRGEFQTHGPQREVEVFNQDDSHPATAHIPASFKIYDEIYEFKNWERGRVHVLLTMHTHPQNNSTGDFPVAWTNRVGKGRMFYTSLGHREDVYTKDLYLRHLRGGLRWALGLAKGDDTPGNPLR
jgi:uncharacterized protein